MSDALVKNTIQKRQAVARAAQDDESTTNQTPASQAKTSAAARAAELKRDGAIEAAGKRLNRQR